MFLQSEQPTLLSKGDFAPRDHTGAMSTGKLSPRGLGLPIYKDPKIPSWPGLPYLQGIQPLVALLVVRSTGNKIPRGLSAAMSLGHTIPSWPWVVSL
uniref:Uncharacterized protein n=1 Tax=Fagus sylvatica TaxID=28930 RepID=A0A2N9GWF9_FAGSY